MTKNERGSTINSALYVPHFKKNRETSVTAVQPELSDSTLMTTGRFRLFVSLKSESTPHVAAVTEDRLWHLAHTELKCHNFSDATKSDTIRSMLWYMRSLRETVTHHYLIPVHVRLQLSNMVADDI